MGEPFDSNLPIQWDDSASVDLDGLSRYYSAASAHLRRGAPQGHMALKMLKPAREMSLVQLPKQMIGEDKDWHERKWSNQHYMSVAGSRVDDTTAKGIWKSKDEAWEGIDKVLPTDTRYEYQTMHSGHGQEAKMEAFLDHAHHQLKLLHDALPSLAADKESTKELETLKGVMSVGEDALEKIERDTIIDDTGKSHAKRAHEMTDQELGLSDKFKVLQGNQLRQTPSLLARRAHYENAHSAKVNMNSYFTSLDAATQREDRSNAKRAGENVHEVHRRDQLALDHSTGRVSAEHEVQLHQGKKQQAERFMKALSAVLNPQQVQKLQSSDDSCGMCIAVMGCKDCCELFCTADGAAASAKPVPKCPLTAGEDAETAAECDDSAAGDESAEGKLEGEVRELKAQLKTASSVEQAQHATLEAEILKVSKQISTQHSGANTQRHRTHTGASDAKAARMPCECSTQECKECPDSDYEVRVRRDVSAAQQQQQMEKQYPAADAAKFKKMFEQAVKEAGTAAVKEAEKEEKAKLNSAGGIKAGRLPCDCDTADCGNCPQEEQVRRRARGRSGQGIAAKVVSEEKKNRALKKAEVKVAKSNAILQKRVAALQGTNAMAIRQGLGVYGDLSGDDTEWQAREPYPGKSETLGNSVLQPAMDLQKQLFGARREVKLLKSQLATQRSKRANSKKPPARRSTYMRQGKANNDILPFYEQPGYGGKNLVKDVREFRKETANGATPPY